MESSSDPNPAEEVRNWLEMPRDVMSMILLKLGAIEILTSAQNVCSLWRNICKDPAMWRVIDMRNLGDLWDMEYNLETMCKHAIDRSCGQLIDINIEYFGTNELLQYITNSTSQLKRLRLVCCYNISGEGLSKTAEKLPFLEEVEISYCFTSKEAVEAIGQCCPLLKSLKLNNRGTKHPRIEDDEEAISIAKNMHELRHLQIFGNKLTNVGLKAILDGCPHLESLDIRQCFNVILGGNMRRKCFKQIKNLRLPYDPTDDYEFDAEVTDEGVYDYASCDEDYPSGFSEIDFMSEDDDDYEFSAGSDDDFPDYGDFLF